MLIISITKEEGDIVEARISNKLDHLPIQEHHLGPGSVLCKCSKCYSTKAQILNGPQILFFLININKNKYNIIKKLNN